MKCPKCETAHDVEIRRKIQQTPPDKHPCPKCGSEMKKGSGRSERRGAMYCTNPYCWHEEKVGEKPECFYRSGVEIGQCAICPWLHECSTQKVGEKK